MEADRSAACVHNWRFRSDIPVRDFGKYGVATYECSECGLIAESDPDTGYVKQPQLNLVNAALSVVQPAWNYDEDDNADE